MDKFLVLRLSSMGDVLLTLPVVKGILESNPNVHLILVTRLPFKAYFSGIERLSVIPFDPQGRHKGFAGIIKLYGEIVRHEQFGKVIDLHGILRTYLLSFLFWLAGHKVYRVKKHRKLRRKIIQGRDSGLQIPHTLNRYLSVFQSAGLTGVISANIFAKQNDKPAAAPQVEQKIRIGIAPLSKHSTKNWGLSNIRELIHLLQDVYAPEIHLFGGKEDFESLNSMAGPRVFNHAGQLSPADEILQIGSLDLFLSMDSANMHLASLTGVPTFSIWGATDPRLGFAPFGQPEDFILHADSAVAYCRPCSVFGEIPCRRKDSPMICMTSIPPIQIFNKLNQFLTLSGKKL